MKFILCLTKSDQAGGVQNNFLQITNALKKEGHEVGIICEKGEYLKNEFEKAGAFFFENEYFKNSYNPFNFIKAILKNRKIIKKFQPDLVHCQSSFAGLVGRISTIGISPTIFTAASWAFTEGAPFKRRLVTLFLEYGASFITDKIICCSEYDLNLAKKYFWGTRNKLITIHNGVDRQNQIIRNDNGKVRLVFIGRKARQKKYRLLMNTYSDLPQKNKKNTELIMIGGDFESNDKNIISLGKITRKEVNEVLSLSDIFVLTSNWEGFPYSILEAMSFGLPVIASDVGGVKEMVSSKTGVLLDKKNEEEHLRKALIELIEDSKKRIELGQNAYELVTNYFYLDKMIDEVFMVYSQVLDKKIDI